MNFFYHPNLDSEKIVISGSEYRHGIKSMRKRVGDTVHLIDGKGTLATARIQNLRKQEAECAILEIIEKYQPLPFQLHLCIAPTKHTNRWEWLLEKCTEIGCTTFSPILCEHSERKHLRLDRSQKILISAMKQSLKAFLPQLNPLTPYTQVLHDSNADKKFICTGAASNHILKHYQGEFSVQVLIGPEGDFSPEEVDSAIQQGFIPVHLGSERLRTETAAIVANALIANYPRSIG